VNIKIADHCMQKVPSGFVKDRGGHLYQPTRILLLEKCYFQTIVHLSAIFLNITVTAPLLSLQTLALAAIFIPMIWYHKKRIFSVLKTRKLAYKPPTSSTT